jgi:surfeit locus 1 family protein
LPSIAEKFHPSWLSTLILGALIVAFLWLGNWQLDRAAEKAARQKSFTDAPQFETLPPAVAAVRYARVDIAGRFDPERHVLIDNQVFLARPGVHVLSPFYLPDGRTILVNRGWLPLAPDRRSLPDFSTDPATTTIPGILDELSLPGTRLGEPEAMSRETWPQLLTYPQVDAIAGALGLEVYPYVLLLGPLLLPPP